MLIKLESLELAERARLIRELRAENIHVASPSEAGVDALQACLDPFLGLRQSRWIPLQVVMIGAMAELLSRRIEVTPGATLTIVVTIASTDLHVSTYALTPAELLMVKMVGLIEIGGTDSYVRSPARSSGQATALQQAISTYAIAAGQWRAKLRAALAHGDAPSWVPSNTPSRRSEG